MGGFGRTKTVIKEVPAAPVATPQTKVEQAQERQAERAEIQETKQMQGAQTRRRRMRSGGMRLLFSQLRQEGPGALGSTRNKLGGS